MGNSSKLEYLEDVIWTGVHNEEDRADKAKETWKWRYPGSIELSLASEIPFFIEFEDPHGKILWKETHFSIEKQTSKALDIIGKKTGAM